MILFHGTLDRYAYDIWTNGIDLRKSKPFLDFGRGFYTTNERELALRTACVRAKSNNSFDNKNALPAVVKLKIDDTIYKEFRTKIFNHVNDEWANFVINNRCNKDYIVNKGLCNHNHNLEYDVVIGPTADGKVTNVAHEVMNGIYIVQEDIYKKFLTKEGKDLGKQVSFHSKKIVSCIKVIEYVIIKT